VLIDIYLWGSTISMRYNVYGTIVESDMAIADLPSGAGRADWSFCVEGAASRFSRPRVKRWDQQWLLPSGEVWLAFARRPYGYLLRFPNYADYEVDRAAATVVCRPLPGVNDETIQHLFLDQVLPLVLSTHGQVLLHASAVVTPAGIAAFAGEAGMGKSTLATSFAASGYSLVTDDCLHLDLSGEQPVGIPGYPGLRLWDSSINQLFAEEPPLSEVAHYSEKKRLAVRDANLPFCDRRLPVCGIFFLVPHESESGLDIQIARLSEREAFLAMTSYTFKLDIWSPEMLAADFRRMRQIVASLPCYRLSFSRGFEKLPRVREAILEQVRNVETFNYCP